MKDFFRELFEYSHYFNQKLWYAFHENQDKVSEKSVQLYCHMLNAHHIWNNRINAMQPLYKVWQIHSIQNCKEIDKANYESSLRILDRFNLKDTIHYKTSIGQDFTNSIRDTLFHVVNHSTYHRGQIAAEFRRINLEPIVTDYIFYKR